MSSHTSTTQSSSRSRSASPISIPPPSENSLASSGMSTRRTPDKLRDVELGPLLTSDKQPSSPSQGDGSSSSASPATTPGSVRSSISISSSALSMAPLDDGKGSGNNSNKDTTALGLAGNAAGRRIVSAVALYSFCSVSMVLTNKSLASSYQSLYEGDLTVLLVVFQAVVAVIAVEFSKKMKWVEYPNFSVATARQWAPVNLFFCAMLFTGMAALQHNTVPMVTIFKNITNIAVTAGDYFFFDSRPEFLVIVAFGIMLLGATAAAWNDIYITWVGLMWMILNCASTAGYVLYMKFATKHIKLSKFGMVFYNNVLCTCFLLPCAMAMGQVQTFMETPAIHSFDYFFKNAFAGFVGFFLNFASLNCVSATGPTTYSIIGSMNKIPVAFLGYFLFDNVITSETWFFIAVSMAGGFLYSFAKIQSSRKKAAAADTK